MSLVDLARVSVALRVAIAESIGASAAWAPPAPTVELIRPEAMTGEGLTLFLFGIGQASIINNQPGDPRGLPLGLELQYQLCAHGSATPPTTASVERQQLLLGLAMKALHDTPRLTATTTVAGVNLFAASGIDEANSLAIELRTTAPEQALAWWNASPSGPEAAAYYTVSVVQIQEHPSVLTGPPVLSPEVFGFASLAPTLTGTSATTTVAQPGRAPQVVTTSPAQVEPGAMFEIAGTGFHGDLRVVVQPDGAQPSVLGGANRRTTGASEVLVTALDRRLDGRRAMPGTARVWVSRTESRVTSTGDDKTFTTDSNQTPIQIVPELAIVAPASPGAALTLNGGPFAGPGVDPAGVRVMIGLEELQRSGGPPGPGEFQTVDDQTIAARPTMPSDGPQRVRVIVNGAENLPTWIAP